MLLNILGGMDRASSGSYLFQGRDRSHLKDVELAVFCNKIVVYVFQAFHLISELDLIDNIDLPLGYAGIKKKNEENEPWQC